MAFDSGRYLTKTFSGNFDLDAKSLLGAGFGDWREGQKGRRDGEWWEEEGDPKLLINERETLYWSSSIWETKRCLLCRDQPQSSEPFLLDDVESKERDDLATCTLLKLNREGSRQSRSKFERKGSKLVQRLISLCLQRDQIPKNECLEANEMTRTYLVRRLKKLRENRSNSHSKISQ